MKVHTENLYGGKRWAGGCSACIEEYGPYRPEPGQPDRPVTDWVDEAGRVAFENSPFRVSRLTWEELPLDEKRAWLELGLRRSLAKGGA